jgi:hypothetical protein
MGVMCSVAVKKVDFITDTASKKALAIAVKELNARESWFGLRLKYQLTDIQRMRTFLTL